MEEDDAKPRQFYAVSYQDDIPKPGKGLLIPYGQKVALIKPGHGPLMVYATRALVPMAALFLFITVGVLGVETYSTFNTASLPTVSVINPFTTAKSELTYGTQSALSNAGFFADTRDAFVTEGMTFIDVDLTTMRLRFFEDGVLLLAFPVTAKGERGTFWQTPSGLYAVTAKKERHYSSFGNMYQPFSITFAENFFIHGEPEYKKGEPLPSEFLGGGIRLRTENAKILFESIQTDIPVLVHEAEVPLDTFLYEPKIPALKARHYLIADIKSSTILASSDSTAVAPIASVTKLMTALIAAETINLDSSVAIRDMSFVQSIIPRLGDRNKVSMYSLLELLLIESSNEAADVIAAQVGREKFISAMNAKARSLGMSNTTFADPSGLSAGNTSSPGDLLLLTQFIYKYRSFIIELTADRDLPTTYTRGEFGQLVNFNLTEDSSTFIGGKVGETIAAGQTSVSLHRLNIKQGERIIAIILLGSSERSSDVTKLYDYATERFGQ